MTDIAASFRATCWHEAGHAVAALVQGLTFNEVNVAREGDQNGYCIQPSLLMYDVSSKRERRARARGCIIVSYAGIEAERLLDPDAPQWHGDADFQNAFETSRDYEVLPRGASFVGDEIHIAYLDRLRRQARRLVTQHQATIQRLAEALSVNRRMDAVTAAKAAGIEPPVRPFGTSTTSRSTRGRGERRDL
jgi:hypothetical protein